MASFDQHIKQSLKNVSVLQGINSNVPDSWDWQVTTSFYSALHLVNAHLASVANLHYRTHKDVKNALFSQTSPAKIPEDIYLSYAKLELLSRRARYLCTDNANSTDDNHGFLTYDKHLKKALHHLDVIIDFFSKKYNLTYPCLDLDCLEILKSNLKYFKHCA